MPLLDFLAGLGVWNWVFLGLALGALEMLIPGVQFVWFGLSALATGIITMIAQSLGVPLGWPLQLVLFALLSVVAVYGVRRYAPPNEQSDVPDLNARGAQLIGRTAVIENAIIGGRGRVRIGDTLWPAKGPDLPAGASARVTGADDTVLIVEQA
ncbi:MAG: NfeD family protein [Hyphomicrobiaceae bacterium]|jgi:inner membrane protein|nr:NfeD family protein [Hyphomicrobiaceae bacterium]